jgi:pimeloyl-ACP methyl ester carboxylesterase
LQASTTWLNESGAAFCPDDGYTGLAQLRHYAARFSVWGDGPPLVVVPGLAGGYELLGPLARILARDFRVISYQLRGEDDCFALRRHFDLADLAGDLHEFLDWLGLERPPVLGVSFGGVLALELAARWPHRLQSLMVQGVGGHWEGGMLQRVAGWVLSRYPLPGNHPFLNQFFNLLFGSRQQASRELFAFVTRHCWQTDQSVMAHRFGLLEGLDLRQRLGRIRTPTLALAGERDLLVSDKGLAELQRRLPHARLVRLPRCGHLAFVTHPEQVADEVKHFLDRPSED